MWRWNSVVSQQRVRNQSNTSRTSTSTTNSSLWQDDIGGNVGAGSIALRRIVVLKHIILLVLDARDAMYHDIFPVSAGAMILRVLFWVSFTTDWAF